MTVGRLAAAALVCAGLGAAGAVADDEAPPLDVAVPVGEEADAPVAVAVPPGDGDSPGAMSEEPLDEEYFPLDLPALPEPGTVAAGPAADAATPGMTEPEDSSTYYQVHAEILGIPNSEGVVAASLCTRRNFTKKGCRTERVAAREGQISVTFARVAPGAYAVQVHHDQNNNGKMDFTFFGTPKEPYGFSRDARPVLAPPKFESASFEVIDGDVRLVINLQNV